MNDPIDGTGDSMTTGNVVLITALVILVIAVGAALYLRSRRTALQRTFGPEYKRVVEEEGGRFRAEQELVKRKRKHDQLDIRPLSEASRQRHSAEWSDIEQLFVDDPRQALERADGLVAQLLEERGYPTDDRRWQEETLSVEHATVMERYRNAHEVSALNAEGRATTEQLRRATVDYRSLVEQLLAPDPETSRREE
jgi:hypothetical protein